MGIPTASIFTLAATAVALVVGCGSTAARTPATPPPPPAAAVVQVVTDPATIGVYTPASTAISAGQEVEWDFQDLNPHTVSADPGNGGYSSPESIKGKTYRHRFDKAGTYKYHCAIHPEMHGTVVVS